MALIEVQGVAYRYPEAAAGVPPALDGIDLSVRAGEFVAVVGGNGSGKSTLARLCNALLLPTEGTIRIGGHSTATAAGSIAARRRVGLVFQNPDNQIVAAVVEDDVAFGPENLGLAPAEIGRRVAASLDAVGLAALARSNPHRLSGGQKQRVAIAGVLAMEPDCLCLDEPTSQLDPDGRAEVLGVLRDLHRAGRTIVLITHHMAEAAQAQRLVVLSGGRVAADGPPRTVLADPAGLAGWGLQAPPSVRVWAALRGKAGVSGSPPLTIPELAARLAPALRSADRRGQDGPGRGLGPCAPPSEVALGGVRAPGHPHLERRCVRDSGGTQATGTPGPCGVALTGVRFAFPDPSAGRGAATPAIQDIDIHLAPGECVGLLGATGSGKSTVAQHCCALLQPDVGILDVEGVRPWALPRRRRSGPLRAVRRRVGLVFQHPEDQFFEERVQDEVAFAPRNYGATPAQALVAARAALRAVDLPPEIEARSPFQLSGGQMRRVAIASTLAADPGYLLLDEPSAGLDAQGRAGVAALIRVLKARGVGILLVTHRMEEAATLADRLIVLQAGRIVAAGTTREVFGMGEALATFGLQAPPAVELVTALAAQGALVATSALTLEGVIDAIRDRL